MDYVLFGMGYGATLMLLGWAIRTFGPERKYKDVNPQDIDRMIAQRRWVRFIQGLGGVIAIAGTALVLFTFVVMLANPDDETGSFIALVTWGFLAIAVLIWCWFYVSSYGLVGIWSRQDGYGFRRSSSRSSQRAVEGISTARVVPTPSADNHAVESEDPTSSLPPTEISADATIDEVAESDVPKDVADPEADESDVAPAEEPDENPDPEYDFGDSSDTTVPSEVGGRSEAIRRLRERQKRSEHSTN